MSSRPTKPWLSAAEIASALGVTPRAVRRWVQRGHFRPEHVRRFGMRVFISRAVIDVDPIAGERAGGSHAA